VIGKWLTLDRSAGQEVEELVFVPTPVETAFVCRLNAIFEAH